MSKVQTASPVSAKAVKPWLGQAPAFATVLRRRASISVVDVFGDWDRFFAGSLAHIRALGREDGVALSWSLLRRGLAMKNPVGETFVWGRLGSRSIALAVAHSRLGAGQVVTFTAFSRARLWHGSRA
ncbi:MAG: hypothetical protein CMM07_08920 [Rhodopirellula sp.]|nr:hypothetical protein [Rhodopirellula sp.]